MSDAAIHSRDIHRELTLIKASPRMTAGRKAIIVEAVRRGILTHAHACETYDLSLEELNSWLERDKAHGTPGLAVLRLQEFRR